MLNVRGVFISLIGIPVLLWMQAMEFELFHKVFHPIAKTIPANISLFKVNNRNTGKRCEICSKLIIKTPERQS